MYLLTPLVVSCLSVVGIHIACLYTKHTICDNPIYIGTLSSYSTFWIFEEKKRSRSRGRSRKN